MRLRLGGLAAAVLLAAAPAMADQWTIDPGTSLLAFTGSQSGAAFDGRFTRWRADIDFDPARPSAGHVVVVVDMNSAVTGDITRDQSLPQADWFDLQRFPEARFEAREFRPLGGNAFEAPGDLTIRGVRKPAALRFTLDIDGAVAHAKGRLAILRSDFGVGQGAWKSDQIVGLEVGVIVDVTARRR
ncbi:MAG TPA: YceI family protein [Rhodospirillaceae bacterium]|nr:YceI family protein [Rhodospirillaceae bacterium]